MCLNKTSNQSLIDHWAFVTHVLQLGIHIYNENEMKNEKFLVEHYGDK
jgi:hypothetical protein